MQHPSFLKKVEEAWKSLIVEGKKRLIFKEKLKILKASLKVWSYEVFGKLDLEVGEAVKELNCLDHLVAMNDVALGLDRSYKRAKAQSSL